MRKQIQVLLIALTIHSFYLIIKGTSSRDGPSYISPSYIYLNLFAATAHLAICLHVTVTHEEVEDFLVHTPIRLEDYLNLAQFAVIWAAHLWLFFICLEHSDTRASSLIAAVFYALFFLAAFIPICIEACLPQARGDFMHDRGFFSAMYTWALLYIVNPIGTLSIALSVIPQAREILNSPKHSLPVLGPLLLAYQALIFLGLGLAWQTWWTFRGLTPRYFVAWYTFTGWAVFNAVLYAAVQGILLLLALWWRSAVDQNATSPPSS